MKNRSQSRRLLTFVCLLLLAWVPVAEASLATITELYAGGDAEAAYQAATGLRDALEGDPEFDYYYGLAALDTGRISEGVFALERVLVANPGDDRVRLELARGYFLLGEDSRARVEFVTVLGTDPPPKVRQNIQQHLDAIRLRQRRYQTSVSLYAELGLGYDTNVNGAPADANFSTPILGPGTLTDEAVRQNDGLWSLGAGGRVEHPLRQGQHLYLTLSLNQSLNNTQSEFDTGNVSGSLGLNTRVGANRYDLSLSAQHYKVDRDPYRNMLGVNGVWTRQLGPRARVSGFAQLADLRYPDQDVRNSRLMHLGIGGDYQSTLRMQPRWSASLYTGMEDPVEASESALVLANRFILGARGEVQLALSPRLSLTGAAAWQGSRYPDENPLFLARRSDHTRTLSAGFTWLARKRWSVLGDLSYLENDSSISIYRYRRSQGLLKVRYEYY